MHGFRISFILPACLAAGLCVVLAPGCGEKPPPNILLIVLDTVRADFLPDPDREGADSLLPALDRISEEGMTFLNARAAAPWTVPSHASIFTGFYPHDHGAVHGEFSLDRDLKTLAEALRAEGYTTIGVNCNPWLNRQSGFAQGFDVYDDIYRRVEEEDDKGASLATAAASEWLTRLAGKEKPFFMFINLLEAHLPYAPPHAVLEEMSAAGYEFSFDRFPLEEAEEFIAGERTLTRGELRTVHNLYLAEIAYLDGEIGELYGLLDRLGLLDGTVLIITSDHGEHLGGHELMGHEFSVYHQVLRVPLLIRYPPVFPPGEQRDTPVSLVDLYPTIRSLTGIAESSGKERPGRSLVPSARGGSGEETGRVILAEYGKPATLIERYWRTHHPEADLSAYERSLRALVRGSYKYIETGRGREFLFDIESDPGEKKDLSESRPEALQTMHALADSLD